nr:hypothetical protein [Tessaracoccus coleopterorum]
MSDGERQQRHAEDELDDADDGLTLPVSAGSGITPASSVNAVTATTMPTNQPTRKPRPSCTGRGDMSIRMTAMIGTGLMAMATALGSTAPRISSTRSAPSNCCFARANSSAVMRPCCCRAPSCCRRETMSPAGAAGAATGATAWAGSAAGCGTCAACAAA